MTNSMTDRELYLLTECMEWKICDHIRCKARREIAELRAALNEARQRLVALGGDPVLDALNGDSRLADEPSAHRVEVEVRMHSGDSIRMPAILRDDGSYITEGMPKGAERVVAVYADGKKIAL